MGVDVIAVGGTLVVSSVIGPPAWDGGREIGIGPPGCYAFQFGGKPRREAAPDAGFAHVESYDDVGDTSGRVPDLSSNG